MRRAALFLFALAVFACDEDPPGDLDSGTAADAGASADGRAGDDASPGDAFRGDAGELLADAMIGDAGAPSLLGTSLENVAVEWPDTLELCSAWREGIDRTETLAARAYVTLPSQPRASLERSDLFSALLLGVVRWGPFAAEQLRIPAGAGKTITEYEVMNPIGDTSLFATIAWDLGAAGVLSERYSLTRMRGNTTPVVFGPELSFTLKRPASRFETYLEPCGGPARLRSAFEVLSATNGARAMTLLRQIRTEETFEGSYPLYWVTTTARFSDSDFYPYRAFGFWPQTYVAQHHNWNETSLINFTEDLVTYDQLYERYLLGQPTFLPSMVTRVELSGVNPTSGAASLDVHTLDFTRMQTSIETWQASRWTRVDSESLRPAITAMCADGEVYTFSDLSPRNVFQLLVCPRMQAPGWELRAVVPIAFELDSTVAGTMISGPQITPITFGFSIAIGASRVEIMRQDTQGFFTLSVYDSMNNLVANNALASPEMLEEEIYADQPFTATSSDATVSVAITRRAETRAVGFSVQFSPVRASFTWNGETHQVEAWDRLVYSSTHHNWSDHLEAEDENFRMYWRTQLGANGLEDFVRVQRIADGVEVVPETQVFQGR